MSAKKHKILDCFGESFIGIETCGDQESGSGHFWEDHPKLNLKVASKLVDGLNASTGVSLLKKYERRAIKKVVADMQAMLSYKDFQVNSILSDKTIKKAGTTTWDGCEDNWYSVVFKARNQDDKFRVTCWDSIGLVVNRNVAKKFYIQDEYGTIEKEVNLKKGYNTVNLDIESDSCEIRVFFNANGVQIGRKKSCNCNSSCNKCSHCDCGCGSLSTERSLDGICFNYCADLFAFDACIQCRCSMDKIACFYKKDLGWPIFYMSGILAFEAAKLTDKTNPCFRNETEDYEYLLDMYRGETVVLAMGEKVKKIGKYQESLLTAIKSIRQQMKSMKTDCLTCTGGRVAAGF